MSLKQSADSKASTGPRVLNRSKFEHDEHAVYIGRGSKWGNPYRIGIDGTRAQVLDLYKTYLQNKPELLADVARELTGKNLVCWCAPKPCHGDLLLEIANA